MELKIQCSGYEIAADWYEGLDKNKILIVLPGYNSSKEGGCSLILSKVSRATSKVVF